MLPLVEHTNGSVKNGTIQSDANDDNIDREKHTSAPQSGLNGNDGQEYLKHVPSSTPQSVSEHLDPNSQMELVGHSIMLTPYPYPDPHYGGMMTYGVQVHPHLLGLNQTRMPLPLAMEEEPVYVNAKQYHGILRRRQSRAKAELEKKVIKARKPYLHESRHQHAMRRERGCGGRFLRKSNNNNNATNPTSENEPKSGETVSNQSANSSGSEHWPSNGDGNSYQLQQKGARNFSNGSGNGHGLSSLYYSSSMGSEKEGSRFNQERESMLAHHSPHGMTRIK